ncbi:hypothetical protein Tsubulata_038975 [Turnera subulata]|uniref:DUF4283 domain-containing protein n=1 Tax=Turnera subulata TaxID=218843 RepID=A0A9Q0F2E7_9ROSI|nr:hypothetical protein Tsubulata_038975 [Turnera subulata]
MDVAMEDTRVSYKEKLTMGSMWEEDEDFWMMEDEPEVEEGDITIVEGERGPSLILSDSLSSRLNRPWERVVIVKLLGRSIGYKALGAKLMAMRKPVGPIYIIDLEFNFYVVKFSNEEDMHRALLEGPWSIFNNRGQFAKVAVRIDLTKPVKGTVTLDGEEIKVPKAAPQASPNTIPTGHPQISAAKRRAVPGLGEWINVQPRAHRSTRKPGDVSHNQGAGHVNPMGTTGNRFSMLAEGAS